MKLKFRYERESQALPEVIRKRIIIQLENCTYNVLDNEPDKITFDNYTGMPVNTLNADVLKKVDWGELLIHKREGLTIISYCYALDILYQSIGVILIMLLSLLSKEYKLLFFLVPIFIQGIVLWVNCRKQAKLLLDYIAWNGNFPFEQ